VISLLAADVAPARGAPLSDIVPAAIVGLIAAAMVGAFLAAHRRGRVNVLRRMADWSDRTMGIAGVAAVPVALTTTSLLIAVFGFYWDVSWHIDRGRDPGPLANPAHWFIIVGLAGIALAGVLAVAMQDHDDESEAGGATGVHLRPGWVAPVGGVLLAVCGLIALAGFPLDDAWHRIFGQDVTLWGPTHIQMVGGASLATLAMWALTVEGRRATRHGPATRGIARLLDQRDIASGGALLIGLSTLQGEFDFGVPQFRQLYHPVLIALAAAVALVAVRIRAGRGAALGAALFFIGARGLLTLAIGPLLGRSILHFPLYLAEALVVEAVAIAVPRTKQLTLGLWAGLGIGTIGTLAEFAWSHVWMPLPWHAGLLARALPLTVLAGAAGGVIGGLVGRALAPKDLARQATPRGAAAVAWVAVLAALAIPAPMTVDPATAQVALHETVPGLVTADVRLNPPDAAKGADWFNVTAWQGARTGDGGLVIRELRPVEGQAGVYRTEGSFPVTGEWKALLRLANRSAVQVVPVYLPDDPAIPAEGVPASPTFSRPFVADKQVLQREAVGGSLGLQRMAYAILVVLALAWIGSLAWGLRRLDRSVTGGGGRPRPPARARRPATAR
jgi:hypothetical protein